MMIRMMVGFVVRNISVLKGDGIEFFPGTVAIFLCYYMVEVGRDGKSKIIDRFFLYIQLNFILNFSL